MEQFIHKFRQNQRPELMTDPDAWSESDSEIASKHFEHLHAATEKGVVILAGRDPSGVGLAIVIFEAINMNKAVDFMNSDPFISSGLFLADLHEFRVALQSK